MARFRGKLLSTSTAKPEDNDLAKHTVDGGLLYIGEEMAVATSHLLGRVTDELVDEALVDSGRSQVADEAMT